VAEQNSKGIALVILGIVAIIAIVGLVLLFTGAKKAATGEFYVPTAKEYGGAVRGLSDPYSRAFVGRSVEFPSGVSGEYMDKQGTYSGLGREQQKVANTVTGEKGTVKTVSTPISYNRNLAQIPSMQTSCLGWGKMLCELGVREDLCGKTLVDLTAQQAQGWQGEVIPVDQIEQILYQVPYYGLNDVKTAFKGMGHLSCGVWSGGGNNPSGAAV
jgi:hypothetical protein